MMKRNIGFLIVILLAGISLCSCNRYKLRHKLTLMQGQTVSIPQNLQPVYQGQDTLFNLNENALTRLIIYYDSVGCASCRVNRLATWDGIVLLSKAYRGNFEPIFIFAPGKAKIKDLKIALEGSFFEYPVWIDTASLFLKQNPFIPADDDRFHTFLLDKSNRVVLVGDPVSNEKLHDICLSTIKEIIENQGYIPESVK